MITDQTIKPSRRRKGPISPDRRRAQNRDAQKRLRLRKISYLKSLEVSVTFAPGGKKGETDERTQSQIREGQATLGGEA